MDISQITIDQIILFLIIAALLIAIILLIISITIDEKDEEKKKNPVNKSVANLGAKPAAATQEVQSEIATRVAPAIKSPQSNTLAGSLAQISPPVPQPGEYSTVEYTTTEGLLVVPVKSETPVGTEKQKGIETSEKNSHDKEKGPRVSIKEKISDQSSTLTGQITQKASSTPEAKPTTPVAPSTEQTLSDAATNLVQQKSSETEPATNKISRNTESVTKTQNEEDADIDVPQATPVEPTKAGVPGATSATLQKPEKIVQKLITKATTIIPNGKEIKEYAKEYEDIYQHKKAISEKRTKEAEDILEMKKDQTVQPTTIKSVKTRSGPIESISRFGNYLFEQINNLFRRIPLN